MDQSQLVLRSVTRKLLKRATGHLSALTTNYHSRLKIAVICVQASLSGFVLPRSVHFTSSTPLSSLQSCMEVIRFHVVNHHILLTYGPNASGVVLPNFSQIPYFVGPACRSNFAFPSLKTCFGEWNSRSFTTDN